MEPLHAAWNVVEDWLGRVVVFFFLHACAYMITKCIFLSLHVSYGYQTETKRDLSSRRSENIISTEKKFSFTMKKNWSSKWPHNQCRNHVSKLREGREKKSLSKYEKRNHETNVARNKNFLALIQQRHSEKSVHLSTFCGQNKTFFIVCSPFRSLPRQSSLKNYAMDRANSSRCLLNFFFSGHEISLAIFF